MTFQGLYQESARLALDPNYDAFDIDHYKQWVNDGNLYVAKRLPLALVPNLFTSYTEDLIKDVEEYTWQSDFLRPVRIRRDGKDCNIVDLSKWMALDRNTYYTASADIPYAMILGNKFYVKPAPTATITDGLISNYVKRPTVMVATDSTPDIDDQYHYLIARYGAYIAKLINQDEGATTLLAEIDNEIKSLIELHGA